MFEYSSIPQISDLRKCRLCFDNQTSLIHIFETTGSLNEVARTISEVLNFEVSANDHFPPFVCSYCSAKLFDFRAFKAKCYSLRETYKLLLQRKAECFREVYGRMPVAENMESRVYLERNIAEPTHEEVYPYNASPLPTKAVVGDGIGVSELNVTEHEPEVYPYKVSPLPMKVEDAVGDGIRVSEQNVTEQKPEVSPYIVEPLPLKVEHSMNDDGIRVSEPVETEQISKDSAFNVIEFPIKTELVEDEDETEIIEEAEMSEEAEIEQIPESRKQVWFQMNPPDSEVNPMQLSNYPSASERSGPENIPESSNYHLDRSPIIDRKLDAEEEVIYSETCSSVSETDFPEDTADVTIPEMADKSSGHSEAHGYHAGSYKPQKKDLRRENPSNLEEDVFGGWRIDDSREEESDRGENRNVPPNDEGNGRVANETVNDVEYVRCHHCGERKLTKDELKSHIYSAHPSLFRDDVVKEINGKEVRRQRCTLCLKDFNSRASLTMHFMTHTGEKPFACNFCGYRTSSNSYLTVHLRRHTGERPFKCTYCDFASAKGVNLKRHIRTHTGERPFKCHLCNHASVSKPELKQHLLVHTKEKPYKCSMCKHRCRTEAALKKHFSSHSEDKPFQCHICGLGYRSKGWLNVHVRLHEEEKSFKCDHCDYRANSRKVLRKHLIRHGVTPKREDMDCKTCGVRLISRRSMRRHVCLNTVKLGENTSEVVSLSDQTEGTNPSNVGEPLKCKECGYIAVPGFSLNQTEGTNPSNVGEPSKCKECGYIAVPASSLEQHNCKNTGKSGENSDRVEATLDKVAISHAGTVSVNREDVLKSKASGYAAVPGSSLNQHVFKSEDRLYENSAKLEAFLNKEMVTNSEAVLIGGESIGGHTLISRDHLNQGDTSNTGVTPIAEDSLTCKVCGFIAPHDISLKHHSCRPPIDKPYKCEQCSFSCTKKENLTLHRRIHTGDKLFKCNHCNFSTVYSNNFKIHMRLHTGEKPHKCHICDFGAVSKSALTVHILNHTGEKPLKCELCEYSTADRVCLKRHMLKHTGEKPFKCHLCDFGTTTSTNLKVHILKHTGEKPLKCELCDYSTAKRACLKQHMRKHTGEKPYKCHLCDFGTTTSTNLKVHILKHTGEKPYKCPHCTYSARYKATLNVHLRKHEKDSKP